MKKVILTAVASMAMVFGSSVNAASMSSTITNGHSVTTNNIQQNVTGTVKSWGKEISVSGGDFSLGNTGWCGRDICSGTDDVSNIGGNVTIEISKSLTKLNENTTGTSVTTAEFCETSFTAGDITATSGIRTSSTDVNTHTYRNNITDSKVITKDYSSNYGEEGYGTAVSTTVQNVNVVDTGYSTTSSYSESETVYSSIK